MAKLTRESRLRERRLDKQARKNARKYAAAHPEEAREMFTEDGDLSAPTGEGDPSTATGETDPSAATETEPAAAQPVAQTVEA